MFELALGDGGGLPRAWFQMWVTGLHAGLSGAPQLGWRQTLPPFTASVGALDGSFRFHIAAPNFSQRCHRAAKRNG